MPAFNSTSLSATLSHVITFLTKPLMIAHAPTTLVKLHIALESNLSAHYAPTWVPTDPLRGSGRRVLTLSPHCLPPRAIYAACLSAGVQWFDWIPLLSPRVEFDLLVDPGCVSVRFSDSSEIVTVWADEVPSPAVLRPTFGFSKGPQRTLAQQILEADRVEEDDLFSRLADEVAQPTWMTPLLDQFPAPCSLSVPPRTGSALSTASRTSSRSSSSSSSGFSFASADTGSSRTSVSCRSERDCIEPIKKQSRREKARQARVFIDTTKTEVTPYDGGKTTVLTGGVMLGGGPNKSRKILQQPTMASSDSWRSVRAV